MCSSMLLLSSSYMSYIPSSKAWSGRLQEVKNNGISLNFQAQKVVTVFLQEVAGDKKFQL